MHKTKVLGIILGVMLAVSIVFVGAQRFSGNDGINSQVVVLSYDGYENRVEGLSQGNGVDYSKISPKVLEMLEENDEVEVIINLVNADGSYPNSDNVLMDMIEIIGFEKINGYYYDVVLAKLNKKEIENLIIDQRVESINKQIIIKGILYDSVNITGAVVSWSTEHNGEFLDGNGQTICIIDSGIDFTHPDLVDKNIVGSNINCVDNNPCEPDPLTTDLNGHGTHVAGIAAAQGGIDGIGKGANLIGLKVFPNDTLETGDIGDLRWAIEWCIANREAYNISVISMSFSDGIAHSGDDPKGGVYSCDLSVPGGTTLRNGINNAAEVNIASVIGTGNDNNSTGIGAPACYSNSIAIAATNKDDTVAEYSNYNPFSKLFAPGGNITNPIISTCIGGSGYCPLTGTSMSTPMVSGAIAILNQFLELDGQGARSMHPKNEIEPLLFNYSDPITGLDFEQWRRLNIGNVITFLVPPACPWDLNNDGNVGINDFLDLLALWGNPYGINDFLDLLANWGPCEEMPMSQSQINPDTFTVSQGEMYSIDNVLKSSISKKEYNEFLQLYENEFGVSWVPQGLI